MCLMEVRHNFVRITGLMTSTFFSWSNRTVRIPLDVTSVWISGAFVVDAHRREPMEAARSVARPTRRVIKKVLLLPVGVLVAGGVCVLPRSLPL